MDYGVLQPIIDTLQYKDNLKILNFQDIKVKRHNNDEIESIESPFTSEKEYETYINSILGDFSVELNQAIKTGIDIDNNLWINCTHKAISGTGSFLLHFRKLSKDHELIKRGILL